MYHVNFLSGGIASWAAGMRVAEKYGTNNLVHLFTDTKKLNDNHPHRGEDEDLYRFLKESQTLIGGELEWISSGKHVWQVFDETRYMGNSRVDPCSRILKREEAKAWVTNRYRSDEVVLYMGLDWTEIHRIDKCTKYWYPYKVVFPLTDEPYLSKEDMIKWVESYGVASPRLYSMGFQHNNCGGFCVKAGMGHFHNLLKQMPDRYMYHEIKQEELFLVLNKRVPFLRKYINSKLKYLSLKEFREIVEGEEKTAIELVDYDDIGGCGCFNDF
ncbi:hypothetical protein [Paenibacillus sp. LPE1-1-1.1]|uniref:hypothetical protein n=1 Tax=Paenibacillus sp. LPE1-1-1.1 TaxID=3135230 RepID=UPI0034282035